MHDDTTTPPTTTPESPPPEPPSTMYRMTLDTTVIQDMLKAVKDAAVETYKMLDDRLTVIEAIQADQADVLDTLLTKSHEHHAMNVCHTCGRPTHMEGQCLGCQVATLHRRIRDLEKHVHTRDGIDVNEEVDQLNGWMDSHVNAQIDSFKQVAQRIDDLSEEQENQEHRLAFLEKKASPYPAFKGANLHFVDKLPIPKCCETCKHGQEDFYSCPEVGESCDYDTGLKKWEPAPAIEQLEKFLKWKGYHIGSTSPDNVVGSDIGALTHLGPGVTRGADGKQSILATALEIQKSDDPERPHKDGGTVDAFYSIADLWNAYLGMEPEKTEWWLGPGDVASMMILLKLAREEVGHNRDNLVDIAGYAHCLQALTEEAE